MRRPRWEIVRTDAGWHARFIAGNGQKIVASEVYVRRRSALTAIRITTGCGVAFSESDGGGWWVVRSPRNIEVREVDERTAP